MKKILLGSIAFFLFAISIAILQTSCGKDANASPDNSVGITQINKLFYIRKDGTGDYRELWTANYNGSGQVKLNLTLPEGWEFEFDHSNCCTSPDGKRIYFSAYDKNNSTVCIFSCALDGSDVIKLVDNAGLFQGAY